MIPSVPGLKETGFLTSESIMELEQLPEHLIILGSGYIGLEFAQMFRCFGSRLKSKKRKVKSKKRIPIIKIRGFLLRTPFFLALCVS
ncbi:FAD-dependent oxidoreductase [Scytonema sp. HK-05]|uniref:FAD-dependent oxidoreductase n=1 Tax=Scytonema sp. HK-05 TaxID=1137095 RepID=UPI000935A0E6|nr:FAD-dependent oxidoreductase [Scytonema sp. HK-05]OKH58203.1 hypothetical protein NIES2130_16095 [Scytonema sp. HK-05]